MTKPEARKKKKRSRRVLSRLFAGLSRVCRKVEELLLFNVFCVFFLDVLQWVDVEINVYSALLCIFHQLMSCFVRIKKINLFYDIFKFDFIKKFFDWKAQKNFFLKKLQNYFLYKTFKKNV